MDNIERNNTWKLIDQPKGIKPLDFKWIFKAKTDGVGNVQKYKGRLVAREDFQIPGINYFETFALVVKWALAANRK